MNNHTVVLLGAGGVGKSAIVARFLKGTFSTSYKPTVEDNYFDTILLGDGVHHLYEVVDTAGKYEFPAMREMNIANNNAFIVVFSVDDHQSFKEALDIADNINRTKHNDIHYVFLVGNKSDLGYSHRKVSYDEALEAALSKECHFIETSAISGNGLRTLFLGILCMLFNVTETPPLRHRRAKWFASKLFFQQKINSVSSEDGKVSSFDDCTTGCSSS